MTPFRLVLPWSGLPQSGLPQSGLPQSGLLRFDLPRSGLVVVGLSNSGPTTNDTTLPTLEVEVISVECQEQSRQLQRRLSFNDHCNNVAALRLLRHK
jgi:hypothetical protein